MLFETPSSTLWILKLLRKVCNQQNEFWVIGSKMFAENLKKRLYRQYRNCRQQYDLTLYIFRAREDYWLQVAMLMASLIGALLSIAQIAIRYFSSNNQGFPGIFHGYEKIVFFASASFGLYRIFSSFLKVTSLSHIENSVAHSIVRTKPTSRIVKGARIIHFETLADSSKSYSFTQMKLSTITNDFGLASEDFSVALMANQRFEIKNLDHRTRNFLSESKSTRINQLQFLVARTRESKSDYPTVNEVKCGIKIDLETFSCDIYKTSYFDSLVTNEAFRRRMFLENTTSRSEVENSSIDLSQNFPIVFRNDKTYLEPLKNATTANGIGVTTIVITSDSHAVFFAQGQTQIDPRSMTACSGSLDWADAKSVLKPVDLVPIIKTGMAREFCEEATAYKAYAKHLGMKDKKLILKEVKNQTLVIGFFRWVNRCGKPEFIGISRTQLRLADLTPDQMEVADLPRFLFQTVKRPEDFEVLYENITAYLKKKKLKISLSSAAALWRAKEIAAYSKSRDTNRKLCYDQLRTLLQ
jgi:hypothetical protein